MANRDMSLYSFMTGVYLDSISNFSFIRFFFALNKLLDGNKFVKNRFMIQSFQYVYVIVTFMLGFQPWALNFNNKEIVVSLSFKNQISSRYCFTNNFPQIKKS